MQQKKQKKTWEEHLLTRPGQADIKGPYWIVMSFSWKLQDPAAVDYRRSFSLFYRYKTEEKAKDAAQRMAEKCPGKRFGVLAFSGVTFKVEVVDPEKSVTDTSQAALEVQVAE